MADPATQLAWVVVQTPLRLHQGGNRADHEEVVCVGKEADTRHDHGLAVEATRWRFVEHAGQGDWASWSLTWSFSTYRCESHDLSTLSRQRDVRLIGL